MGENDIGVEISSLADLDLSALRDRWRMLYGSDAPARISRELFVRAIAYRIQEIALGGLSRAAKAKLAAASLSAAQSEVQRVRNDRSIKPGRKFLREWNGRTHEVMVTADGGFVYRGRGYRGDTTLAWYSREIRRRRNQEELDLSTGLAGQQER